MSAIEQSAPHGPRFVVDRPRVPGRFHIANRLAAALLGFGCAASALAQASSAGDAAANSPEIAIQPLTQVVLKPRSGYFSDPYPIHLASWITPFAPQLFSGTTKEVLISLEKPRPGDAEATPITVSAGPLEQEAAAYGSSITAAENNNIYQNDAGEWQMATTMYVENPAFPDAGPWNVIVHAHPTNLSYPTDWVADSLLVGSFARPAKANYDGKYFEDSGSLYLVYSQRLSDQPAEDGIVAQLMQSPRQPAAVAPVVLIKPNEADGGYNSEYFFGLASKNPFKLIETGNVTRIDGKYALAYSTGAYDEPDYKSGVAWSDTFLPSSGSFYKKVLKEDVVGVWGQPNHREVQYLLQSQESAWPNYVANQVLAPGVPSIVKDEAGGWYLYFAAYAPSDAPTIPATGDFDPSHRRPFFVRLQINIPAGATVAATTNLDLAGWLTPATR